MSRASRPGVIACGEIACGVIASIVILAGPALAQLDTNKMVALRIELESKDQKRIAAVRQQVQTEMTKPERVAFLRYGIWSKDRRAAVWCANKLEHDQVDLREAERVIDLL
ncbi:MAG: hypothetical protein ACYS5W_08235, partial [Planctomycetota bacterium]